MTAAAETTRDRRSRLLSHLGAKSTATPGSSVEGSEGTQEIAADYKSSRAMRNKRTSLSEFTSFKDLDSPEPGSRPGVIRPRAQDLGSLPKAQVLSDTVRHRNLAPGYSGSP